MIELCTSEEAITAIGYLGRCFGGYGIPDSERSGYVRLFRKFTVTEIRDAIDRLVVKADRRPSPNEVAQELKLVRHAVRSQGPYIDEMPAEERTPPWRVPELVQQLRDPDSDLRKVPA